MRTILSFIAIHSTFQENFRVNINVSFIAICNEYFISFRFTTVTLNLIL